MGAAVSIKNKMIDLFVRVRLDSRGGTCFSRGEIVLAAADVNLSHPFGMVRAMGRIDGLAGGDHFLVA